MAEPDDGLVRRILSGLRERLERVRQDQDDLRDLLALTEQQLAIEQSFRRRHEVKLGELESMVRRIMARLELSDEPDRD